jgi:Na+/proline symporter
VVGWYVVAAAIVIGFAAGVIALGLHAPAMSIAFAGAAAFGGAGFALLYARRAAGGAGRAPRQGWLTWLAVGASGPLLAGLPDTVMLVVMAFLWAMVSTLLVLEERRRRKQRTPAIFV